MVWLRRANYTYMKDGKKLLSELAALSCPVFVRTHNLLTTGDGTPALKWDQPMHTLKVLMVNPFITGKLSTAFLIPILKEE